MEQHAALSIPMLSSLFREHPFYTATSAGPGLVSTAGCGEIRKTMVTAWKPLEKVSAGVWHVYTEDYGRQSS